jgi:predicted PurR-regulated permease PerM
VPPPPPAIQEIRIQQERASLLDYAAGYVTSIYSTLLMVSFVPFLVYFMLSWRDHVRRSLLALYQGGERRTADRSWRAIAEMARAFVAGNVILGVIISIVSCIVFWSWHLPYWVLIGFFSGFLSLIPYVGLPLALLPPIAATLITYGTVAPYVILALNLLYPAIVGARVHLNPLAVTIALMFWGGIWGGIGLVLAIPITAALKAFFDNTEGLQPYGRLLGD